MFLECVADNIGAIRIAEALDGKVVLSYSEDGMPALKYTIDIDTTVDKYYRKYGSLICTPYPLLF